jgi:LysR family glycine cleavage system transcriptional activator
MSNAHLPLRSLAVFEAAARLGSFREAAEELGLTASAVSHQIRQLEGDYAVRLFDRVGRGTLLSQEGQRLYDQVHEGFGKLRLAVQSLKGGRSTSGRNLEIVRVSTPPSLASKWLLPRLSGFIADHPRIDIRVNAQPERGFDLANIDLAIVYGGSGKWSSRAAPLLEDAVQPLCAPRLIAAREIRSPRDLLGHTLIRTRGNAVSWEEWLQRNGVDSERMKTIQLDPSHVAIEAAVRGLGIVLESDVLTQDETGSGELVAPLPGLEISAMSYWLVTPRPPSRESVEIVRSWLIERAARG